MLYAQPESLRENEKHKLLWDFEIKMDHLIWPEPLDLIIIIKKKRELVELWTFAVSADHRVKLTEIQRRINS